ncbi:MAG TPA: 6-phosphofructokinase, partial [Candidatus Nanoarchaeia archaeon]|nr:6-phosphofructokinase [Candidatus Nanoarchaeia archaeon]
MERSVGILTGGGDVPGLNPAVSAFTYRALSENIRVVGIRRGWGGLVYMDPQNPEDLSHPNGDTIHAEILTEGRVRTIG